jgi:hypothetical protein
VHRFRACLPECPFDAIVADPDPGDDAPQWLEVNAAWADGADAVAAKFAERTSN